MTLAALFRTFLPVYQPWCLRLPAVRGSDVHRPVVGDLLLAHFESYVTTLKIIEARITPKPGSSFFPSITVNFFSVCSASRLVQTER